MTLSLDTPYFSIQKMHWRWELSKREQEIPQELFSILKNTPIRENQFLYTIDDAESIMDFTPFLLSDKDYFIIFREKKHINDINNPHARILKSTDIIKKLSSLYQFALPVQQTSSPTAMLYYQNNKHTRFEHSRDVALTMEFIWRNNNLPNKDIILLILAWRLHDVATPRLGDITMNTFPELKEEESFLDYITKNKDIKVIIDFFWINYNDLENIVKNKGLYGELLDIADKLAYTKYDVVNYMQYHNPEIIKETENMNESEKEVNKIIHNGRKDMDLIKHIKIKNNQVYFDCKSEKLLTFLKLRWYMHQFIYLDPLFRSQELYSGQILKFLIQEKIITLDELQNAKYKNWSPITYDIFYDLRFNEELIPEDPTNIFAFYNIYTEKDINKILDVYSNLSIEEKEYSSIIEIPQFKPWLQFLIKNNKEVKTLEEILWDKEVNILKELGKSTKQFVLCTPTQENIQKMKKSYQWFSTFLKNQSTESINKFK